jgi:flagellar motor switch protein FliG
MGNIQRRGIDAYRQTIEQSSDGLVKTGRKPEDTSISNESIKSTAEGKQPDTKFQRVAKFLILVGGDRAAEILAELDPEQVEKISKEIALTKVIKPEEGKEILAEFQSLFAKGISGISGSSRGGIETARRILYAAKGPEKGEAILNRVIPESKENVFSFLEEFSPDQLVMLLKVETPQTAALILSRLPSKLSAGTLSKFPPDRKPEILKFIAYQKEVSPEVLGHVADALKEKVRHISGGVKDFEINGMQALAAILKQGDYSFGDRIINELEESSPVIGKELKEKLYTLDDVIFTVSRPLQEKLKIMSDKDIAVLLKGRGDKFVEKLLSCVSTVRRQLILEEYDLLGAVPKRDCDAAAGEFLAWFRQAREEGSIILSGDKDVFL